jgi:3-deoxy-D-manno-octulosonic-acid transferase
MLADPAEARAMSRAAAEAIGSLGGAVDRTMQAIEPFLRELKIGPHVARIGIPAGEG